MDDPSLNGVYTPRLSIPSCLNPKIVEFCRTRFNLPCGRSLFLTALCIASILLFDSYICGFWKTNSLQAEAWLIWNKPPPSTVGTLQWTSCYTNFCCARLMVPLDYANHTGSQASIAMIKLPASGRFCDGSRDREPILLNPGGPGSSGVNFLLTHGRRIRKMVGGDYDLISFDPRGVSRSTPHITVFADKAEGATWNINSQFVPLPNMTGDAVARIHARALLYNTIAGARMQNAAKYVGTAAVARDMLSMIYAHGREKLYYWGFSYGTIIGATFAAMFPHNVGRMILDGVVDANNYYAGLWSNNLRDFDAGLSLFFEACVEAGPHRCALHASDSDGVEARLNRIFDALKRNPLAVLPQDHGDVGQTDYGVMDYATARRAVFKFMFSPYSGVGKVAATELAYVLAATELGDGRPLWQLQQQSGQMFKCNCSTVDQPELLPFDDPSALAIACGEGEPVDDTVDELKKHYRRMAEDSSFADVWPNRRVRCNGWRIRAKERFTGPFVANTSHPILFIGNIADPATPLANAHTMSRGFNGSMVLTQASAGHSSLAATSSCTASSIRSYFRTGRLPQINTICAIDSKMFDNVDQ